MAGTRRLVLVACGFLPAGNLLGAEFRRGDVDENGALEDITELNAGTAEIHALGAYPRAPSVDLLQDLAGQNGGTYTQVAP